MKIKLERTWFAPTQVVEVDKIRVRSGNRYKAGVHVMPDHLFDSLPSSATILEPPREGPPPVEFTPVKKRDMKKSEVSDEGRAMDQEREAQDEADLTAKENRKAILARARAAKADKRKENKDEAGKKPVEAKMEAKK